MRACRLLLIVLVLAVAGPSLAEERLTAEPADAAATVAIRAEAAPLVTVEPVEAERALVLGGEVEAVSTECIHCLMLPDDCPSEDWLGQPCSGRGSFCRCSFCDGFFSCYSGKL